MSINKKPELLAPAGSLKHLEMALAFGADAVYAGVPKWSLRVRGNGFIREDFIKGIELAHSQGKKVHAVLNIIPHVRRVAAFERIVDEMAQLKPDAFIMADPGLIDIVRNRYPDIPIHLSVQANTVNAGSVKFWQKVGLTRCILARELSLTEIEMIKQECPDMEIEVFAHGAMCLAYSGRCFLSKYLADRSANQGDCAHSCRWQYRVLEESERPGEYFPVVQGENFTSILSSKDLCMIDHLKELKDAGVDSIKIEGRMKSIYYTAVITRAYRKQLDYIDGISKEDPKPYVDEIFNVSHREFSTGFYYGKDDIEMPTFKSYMSEAQFLGSIEEQVGKGLYRLDVKNQILASDSIEYIGPDLLFMKDEGFTLLDEDMQPVPKTDHGKIAYIKTDKMLKKGYIIRKKG